MYRKARRRIAGLKVKRGIEVIGDRPFQTRKA